MTWQDILITIIIISFNYALIPQIIKVHKQKKALISIQTASITSIGLFALSITYTTLNLPFSAIMGAISAILWTTLLIQSISYKSNN